MQSSGGPWLHLPSGSCTLHLNIISAGTFAARRCSDAQCDADINISDYRILLLICYVISNTQGRFFFFYWASVSNAGPEAFLSEIVEGWLKLEDDGISWVLVWLTLEWGVNLSMEVQYYCSALLCCTYQVVNNDTIVLPDSAPSWWRDTLTVFCFADTPVTSSSSSSAGPNSRTATTADPVSDLMAG